MEHKTDKELAIDTALEYVKSWNSSTKTTPIQASEFVDILDTIYDAICKLDER